MPLPEFRAIDPTRGERTPENTVMYDIVEEVKVLNSWIDKIYEEGDSAAFTGALKSLKKMSEVIDDLKANMRAVQVELNRPKREQAKISREEKEAFRKERWEAKQKRRELNRQIWRAGHRDFFAKKTRNYMKNNPDHAGIIARLSKSFANPSSDTSMQDSQDEGSSQDQSSDDSEE